MKGNSDKGKIGNAVVNGVGLAGVKIKGKHVGINVAQAEKASPATPFDPKNVDIDNALIGAGGIAGLDIDGDDIELNIGQNPKKKGGSTTTSTTKTEEGADPKTTKTEEEVVPKTTKTEEEVNPKTTKSEEEVDPKPDPLRDFARSQMYIEHIPGRNISLGDTGYDCICPGCAYDLSRSYPGTAYGSGIKIIEQGIHLQDGKVLEQANIKPLSTPVIFYWNQIPGPSIKPRGPPSYGFDVACPRCAVTLGLKRDPIWCYNLLVQGKHLHG